MVRVAENIYLTWGQTGLLSWTLKVVQEILKHKTRANSCVRSDKPVVCVVL
jgi:hypothetical protein